MISTSLGRYDGIAKPTALFCCLVLSGAMVHANDFFNPALLLNTTGLEIADLSKFEQGFQLPGQYEVSIYLNDKFYSKREVRLDRSAKSDTVSGGLMPCITSQNYVDMGIKLYELDNYTDFKLEKCIDLQSLVADAVVTYNFSKQRLDINVPQILVKNEARGYIPSSEWSEGITAGTLDYNLNGSHGDGSNSFFGAFRSGLNYKGFRFRNFSNFSYYRNKYSDSQSRWQNVQNYVEKSIVPLKSELVVGDSSNSNQIFESVGFRGAKLSSSEQMLPNTMQGYAPVVRGIANSKSTVTVLQNGFTVYQTNVQAGPFEINDLSAMALSGDLEVIVEESIGENQRFIIPYSGVPMMLREGRNQYELTLGEFRGSSDLQDTPFFLQGTLSHGLKSGYTLFTGSQISSNYQSYLLGFGKNLGRFGALSLDVTHADSTLANGEDYRGQSYRFLYSKSLNNIGTSLQLLGYRYSTKGYYTLNEATYKAMKSLEPIESYDEFGNTFYDYSQSFNLLNTRKGQFQLNLNQNLKEYGSIYAVANYQSYWNTNKTYNSLQLGYSKSFRMMNVSLSWTKQNSMENDKNIDTYSASLSMPISALYGKRRPFNKEIYSNSSYVNSSSGTQSFQTGINGQLLDNDQLNYNITLGEDSKYGQYGSASARLSSRFGNTGLSYSFANDGKVNQFNYSTAGGAILHSQGITFGPSLGDTNILVDAKGADNVKIENSQNVYTNAHGFAIMPYAQSYRLNRVALDPNSLDEYTEILSNVQNLVPMRGAILKADFESRVGYRALIKLQRNGMDIPYGSSIEDLESGSNSLIGLNSTAFLSGLAQKGKLNISWGAGEDEKCSVNYEFEEQDLSQPLIKLNLNCV